MSEPQSEPRPAPKLYDDMSHFSLGFAASLTFCSWVLLPLAYHAIVQTAQRQVTLLARCCVLQTAAPCITMSLRIKPKIPGADL